MNLPRPLTVHDQLHMSKSHPSDVVTLTACIHRQIWISGRALFVDVNVSNACRKPITKFELQLERTTAIYDHTAATNPGKYVAQLRMPDRVEKEVITKTTSKKTGHGWPGISAHSYSERTWYLDIPPGLASVSIGMHPCLLLYVS